MVTQVTQGLEGYAYEPYLGSEPARRAAVDFLVNFNNDSVFIKEFFQEQSREYIDYVQSIYIDNSASATAVTVSFAGTTAQIVAKAHSQGYYPILCPPGKIIVTVSKAATEATIMNLTLFNFMVPYVNWLTQ
jgi:hypothetical protein